MTDASGHGLSLAPFRALRPTVSSDRLGALLCPPYDVIGPAERAALLARDPDNAVALILPDETDPDRYTHAAEALDRRVTDGLLASDDDPAIYVYEMRTSDGSVTRGLLGAVELRDPDDGVILPHENTMAGPVADRLSLMSATEANLEPIYLVYDGGGAASDFVRRADEGQPIAEATTPDGVVHRLWAITDKNDQEAIDADLSTRKALIADGHHRYATYRELQRHLAAERGAGPWDRGLTLLVDSSSYGPQVHAIHRILVGVSLDELLIASSELEITPHGSVEDAMKALDGAAGFAIVATDGERAYLVADPDGRLVERARRADEPSALAELDVTVLHRAVVEGLLRRPDTVDTVGYAHSVAEALDAATASNGTAILLRPTPVAAVTAVAAAGARMPRKSTLFTPKPASGLVMRRFADER